jgi:hypothetical protein
MKSKLQAFEFLKKKTMFSFIVFLFKQPWWREQRQSLTGGSLTGGSAAQPSVSLTLVRVTAAGRHPGNLRPSFPDSLPFC